MKLDALITRLQELRAKSSDGNVDVLFEVPNSDKEKLGTSGFFGKVWYSELRKLRQEDAFESLVVCISE